MQINATWIQIKDFADTNSLSIQYVDQVDRYIVIASNSIFFYSGELTKTTPDAIDFETNYKVAGNKFKAGKVEITALTSIKASQLTLSLVAQKIPAIPLASRKTVTIKVKLATGSFAYIGQSGITSSVGFIMLDGESIDIEIDASSDVYILASAVSAENIAYVLEIA